MHQVLMLHPSLNSQTLPTAELSRKGVSRGDVACNALHYFYEKLGYRYYKLLSCWHKECPIQCKQGQNSLSKQLNRILLWLPTVFQGEQQSFLRIRQINSYLLIHFFVDVPIVFTGERSLKPAFLVYDRPVFPRDT